MGGDVFVAMALTVAFVWIVGSIPCVDAWVRGEADRG